MGTNPRRRQKQIERRKAKEKARKKVIAQRNSLSLSMRVEQTARMPLVDCFMTGADSGQGLSNVLVSRQRSNSEIFFVVFLVDLYCLGVKDTMFGSRTPGKYETDVKRRFTRDHEITNLSPDAARKLVEGAVAYASDLGIAAHKDYKSAKLIFGDADANACFEEFEYGLDGKPHFIAGPNDSFSRCRQIITLLTNRCGVDGFHFVIPWQIGDSIPKGANSVIREDEASDVSERADEKTVSDRHEGLS